MTGSSEPLAKLRLYTVDVIPAQAGIQLHREDGTTLDPGLRRGDDFLLEPQS